MEERTYNNAIVEKHSFHAISGSTLNEVSNRDYPNSDYFNPDIECLDMDTYESKVLRKSQADRTVDAVIGISTHANNRSLNPRLFLIELRIGYENVSNLSKTEMEGKVSHTRALLGGEIPIKKENLFIFSRKIAAQAERWFDRQSRTGGVIKDCKVCSVDDFSSIIKSSADFPYEPIHQAEEIRNDVQPYAEKAEWMKFCRQVKHWCGEAVKFRYKNPSESVHIITVAKEIWKAFRQEKHDFNEEVNWEIEFMEEDFDFLK